MKKQYSFLFLIALIALPVLTMACPLCQAGATPQTQKAYLETTALLAFIPLAGFGGIFYWILKKRGEN